ncbi:MAG TPA: F0F1 ATP synthase subunit gamma, partial [Brevundimonas sp.]|nr:F0F1 ATP synthase subunit gamma [Brevundimonas sp.]
MASLKEMRNRIGSVKATQKITKAMQMVAAAKLKRAQDQAVAARPYAQRMAAVIANLAAGVSGDGAPKLLAGTGSDRKHLVIVATADKGLAGGFSSNVVRAARDRINSLIAEGKDVRIIAVGRKSRDGLTRMFGDRVV